MQFLLQITVYSPGIKVSEREYLSHLCNRHHCITQVLLLMCYCAISSFREVLERKRSMQTSGLVIAHFTWEITRELWRYFDLCMCVSLCVCG